MWPCPPMPRESGGGIVRPDPTTFRCLVVCSPPLGDAHAWMVSMRVIPSYSAVWRSSTTTMLHRVSKHDSSA